MSTLKTPFKYDFVGSFLRPQALKDAKMSNGQSLNLLKKLQKKFGNKYKDIEKQLRLNFRAVCF